MTDTFRIDIVNLVGIEYTDNGKSLRFELIDSTPPYGTRFITFRNAYLVALCRDRDDGFPFVICEMTWKQVPPIEKRDILTKLRYPFFDEAGDPHLCDTALIAAHLEGQVTGDILAERVDC
jgi:hypothetical protein